MLHRTPESQYIPILIMIKAMQNALYLVGLTSDTSFDSSAQKYMSNHVIWGMKTMKNLCGR